MHLPRNLCLVLVLFHTFAFTLGCQRRVSLDGPCENEAILKEFRSFNQHLSALSPDGKRILGRAKYSDGEEREGLVVRETGTGKIVGSMRLADPVLRVYWRPDGRTVSYFRQEAGTNLRRLFLWELDSDRQREIPIPVSYAQAIVKWSPDGKRLAFTNDRGGLVIVDAEKGIAQTCAPETKIRMFDWNSDSRRIAAVIPSPGSRDRNFLAIIDAIAATITEKITSIIDGTLRQIAWERSENVLLLLSEGNSNDDDEPGKYILTSLDPIADREEVLFTSSPDAFLLRPAWLPGGAGYLWHQREIDGTQRILISLQGQREPRVIALDGALEFRMFLPEQKSMVVSQTSPAVNQFVQIPLGGSSSVTVLGGADSGLQEVLHQSARVRSADGVMVPILVTRVSDGSERANAVFIRMYGGIPALWATWAETRLFLKHGVHLIQVSYRKLHGVQDLLAACDYAENVLKVPRERIVVLGASTASTVVIEAALRRPNSVGILAVVGVIGGGPRKPAGTEVSKGSKPRLLAFHGEKDRTMAPENGRAILENLFGAEALLPPQGLWHVFPGEDHTLKRDKSLAVVYATILRDLGVIECE